MARIPLLQPAPSPEDPSVVAYYEDFQRRLKKMRKRAKLSQAKLCKLIGLSLDSYKQIEGSRLTRFPLHKIGDLADALHESYEYVINGTNSRASAEDERRRLPLKIVPKSPEITPK